MKRNLTRGLLAVAFTAAMGFGAAQAVAAPTMATRAVAGCQQDACTRKCAQDGLIGFCDGRGCWCR